MNLKKIPMIIIIILIISSNVFGYIPNIAYTVSFLESELGEKDGQLFGSTLGQKNGYLDYFRNYSPSWKRYIPSDEEISYEFKLTLKSSSYRNNFLTSYKETYEESYNTAYNEALFNTYQNTFEFGTENGKIFGALDGEIKGKRDFYNGLDNNWEKAIQSEGYVKEKYSLFRDSDDYIKGFIIGYRSAFSETYTGAFRTTNIENNKVSRENGVEHGNIAGAELGTLKGKIDYLKNNKNNWQNAIISDIEIINKYKLILEDRDYRDGFIVGFKDGFMSSYVDAFQSSSMENINGKIRYEEISMDGGIIISSDDWVSLEIEEGTFYLNTIVSIEKAEFPVKFVNSGFLEPTTNEYKVEINNYYDSIELRKPITLTFKYIGSNKGGIYKKVDNKWIYLPSEIKDGTISTQINSQTEFTGGAYSVFIDSIFQSFSDTTSHWAKNEINTYARRYYIEGYDDNTFRPERSITRGEFIALLNRIYFWKEPLFDIDLKIFKDHLVFGSYSTAITNALTRGYINGYPDGTFRPNIPITYQEAEWFIQKLINNTNFKWDVVAIKMLEEKGVSSKGYDDKNQNITRAEAVYLMYNIQENYIK